MSEQDPRPRADDQVHDLLGAWLLNALGDRERAAFEQHLPGCERCRAEALELSAVVEALSADLEEAPPPALRDRVLAQVADEPQGAAPSRRGRRWLAGVAAAAAVAIGAVAITQWPDQDETQVVATVQEVLEAPDASRSTARWEQSELTVVTSASLDRAVLVAEGLDAAPAGEAYQLWFLQEDETIVSAGLVPSADASSQSVLMQGDPEGAVAVAMSLEPEGGSAQPTSDPLVAIPLQQ